MQRHVVIVYHEVGSTKAQLVQQLAVETGAFFKKEKAEQNRTKQKKTKTKICCISFYWRKEQLPKEQAKVSNLFKHSKIWKLGTELGNIFTGSD